MRPKHVCIVYGENEDEVREWAFALRTSWHMETVCCYSMKELLRAFYLRPTCADAVLVIAHGMRLRDAEKIAAWATKIKFQQLVFAVEKPGLNPDWALTFRWIDSQYRTTVFENVKLASTHNRGPRMGARRTFKGRRAPIAAIPPLVRTAKESAA